MISELYQCRLGVRWLLCCQPDYHPPHPSNVPTMSSTSCWDYLELQNNKALRVSPRWYLMEAENVDVVCIVCGCIALEEEAAQCYKLQVLLELPGSRGGGCGPRDAQQQSGVWNAKPTEIVASRSCRAGGALHYCTVHRHQKSFVLLHILQSQL